MKLWIDDIRPAPDGWVWAKASKEAIDILSSDCPPQEISFDHDLGGDDTSMPVAKYIEEMAYLGYLGPIVWYIHSANPVGQKNLQAALNSADKFWYITQLVGFIHRLIK